MDRVEKQKIRLEKQKNTWEQQKAKGKTRFILLSVISYIIISIAIATLQIFVYDRTTSRNVKEIIFVYLLFIIYYTLELNGFIFRQLSMEK